MPATPTERLSRLEYHVLLALVGGPLYGYALKETIERESDGTLSPRPGTLYRVLARLMSDALVAEAAPVESAPHPGRARKYYELTRDGRDRLSAEVRHLKDSVALAEERLGAVEDGR